MFVECLGYPIGNDVVSMVTCNYSTRWMRISKDVNETIDVHSKTQEWIASPVRATLTQVCSSLCDIALKQCFQSLWVFVRYFTE